MLKVDNLNQYYGGSHILRGLSFDVPVGKVTTLLGRNGVGKTTLLKTLMGLVPAASGSISFHDQDILRNMSVAALGRFVGASGLDVGYMEELTDEYISSLGIRPGRPSDIMRSYSGGNQQKVVVARWFMSLCRIFILDEPTRGVDAAARIDIYNAMNDLVTKGAAIILISSDTEEILGMCDRVLVLAGGRIACDLPRSEATSERILDYASG